MVGDFLTMITSTSKRTGLLNFRNAIPTLLGQFLRVTVSAWILLQIAKEMIMDQGQANDPLPLAIPPTEILTYEEAKLLTDVFTLKESLVQTISVPLASKQTALTVYRANLIPMQQPEPTIAMKLKTIMFFSNL